MATKRAFLLGAAATVGGGIVGALCGVILCLADGLPWTYAGVWGLRGAFAGLVAGVVMGAVSGIYHVDEATPARAPTPAAPRKRPGADGDGAASNARTADAARNGVKPLV